MKKEVKLIKKVKRLLRRLKCPMYLHRYGPKTYEFYEHLQALLIKAYCKLSYRRIKYLFDLLGIRCPSKSALQYTMQKLSSAFWQKMLELTSGGMHYLIALDSTGFSRTNPSYHYLRRIDGKIPKIPVKMSCTFDTRKKKFCAAKIRVLPAHDIKDAPALLAESHAKIAVADKAYSSENLYRQAAMIGTLLMVPQKRNAKHGLWRVTMQKQFRLKTYNRRQIVEAANSSLKRKYGGSVSSRTVRTIRTEVYGRLACHNLLGRLLRLLGQSLLDKLTIQKNLSKPF